MKKTNKGFSLVELIIVIAIMAILAGAIAPALIRYIDKSRRSNDVNSAKTIKTAIETALGNESVYEHMTTQASGNSLVVCEPGKALAASHVPTDAIKLVNVNTADINGKTAAQLTTLTMDTIGQNIGEKVPKLKFRKNPSDKSKPKPATFVGVVSPAGTVYVFITTKAFSAITTDYFTTDASVGVKGADEVDFQITPYICDEYQ